VCEAAKVLARTVEPLIMMMMISDIAQSVKWRVTNWTAAVRLSPEMWLLSYLCDVNDSEAHLVS
jgi:hypothetical protein